MRHPKCERCNWKHGGFHVCIIDLRTPEGRRAATRPRNPKKRRAVAGAFTAASQRSQDERWAKHYEDLEPIYQGMIDYYKTGTVGYRQVREKFKVGHGTVVKVLRAAAERGELQIRPRGHHKLSVEDVNG